MIRPEPIPAPDRTVDQHSGTVVAAIREIDDVREANRWLDAMVTELAQARDDARKQRDDAIAERDNMIDLTIEVGRLGVNMRHAIADRDDYRERADEWRDRYESAQCRMDEMSAEIRYLTTRLAVAESSRDTANAKASIQ